jgi:hypothetical protein
LSSMHPLWNGAWSMIRKSGYRFSLRQTQRVCAEIMFKQKEKA